MLFSKFFILFFLTFKNASNLGKKIRKKIESKETPLGKISKKRIPHPKLENFFWKFFFLRTKIRQISRRAKKKSKKISTSPSLFLIPRIPALAQHAGPTKKSKAQKFPKLPTTEFWIKTSKRISMFIFEYDIFLVIFWIFFPILLAAIVFCCKDFLTTSVENLKQIYINMYKTKLNDKEILSFMGKTW